jgi:hypothetical protein
MTHAWTHAWCKSPARDEAVRAAEDGRTAPLPTLEECIVAPFADAAERSSTVSKTGEGQSGMRTERVTLEVTHNAALSAREWHMWRTIFDPRYGESVRVVEEPHFDDLAQVAMQRDAAIREREAWKLLADRTNERLSAAEARVAELEQQIGQADAEDADTGYALRLFVDGRRILSHELGPTQAGAFLIAADHLAKYIREEYGPITDATNARVAALEAASGGGEQEPDAWGIALNNVIIPFENRDEAERRRAISNARIDTAIGQNVGDRWKCIPLYRSPPQPRGWLTEQEIDAVTDAADTLSLRGCGSERRARILRELLARSSPPEVVLTEAFNRFDTYGDRVASFDAHHVRRVLAAAGVAVKEVT